ncbi:MAG: ASPIC/UnbV domain-containing protein [Verrucomicrobiaceae bacterium]
MSQSPEKQEAEKSELDSYFRGWKALSELIGRGRSFSGREKNTAFLNLRDGSFADVSSVTGLDFSDDARAVVSCDWDFDGRVDFWVSNRTAPRVRLLMNEGGESGNWVAIRLSGTRSNRDAIGAKVTLDVGGERRVKSVKAGDGFLAQSSRWLHFGLGEAEEARVTVRWPGGETEEFGMVKGGAFYDGVEGGGVLEIWDAPKVELAVRELPVVMEEGLKRTVMVGRIPLPKVEGVKAQDGKARVLSLWSGTCPLCVEEMKEWAAREREIRESGVEVIAVNVDEFVGGEVAELPEGFPFEGMGATKELLEALELFRGTFVELQGPISLPCHFLLDEKGKVAVMYEGSLGVEVFLKDVGELGQDVRGQRESAVPFVGQWASLPFEPQVRRYAHAFAKAGKPEREVRYLKEFLEGEAEWTDEVIGVRYGLGELLLEKERVDEAVAVFAPFIEGGKVTARANQEVGETLLKLGAVGPAAGHLRAAVPFMGGDASLRYNLGLAYAAAGKNEEALVELSESVRLEPQRAQTFLHLGNVLLGMGRAGDAVRSYRAALKLQEGWSPAANKLAWVLATHGDDEVRDGKEALRLIGPVVEKEGGRNVVTLATLAAGYAEVGNFEAAVQVVERALVLAERGGKKGQVEVLQGYLEEYRGGKALRR